MPSLARLGALVLAVATIVATPAAASTVLHRAQPEPHLAEAALDADRVGVLIDISALHIVDLGTLDEPCCSAATAINDRGDVVGQSTVGPPMSAAHAFLWRAGRMVDLGTLGGNNSLATDINIRGDVVGHSDTVSGVMHAFLWRAGQMVDLGTLGGETSVAVAINDRGEVTGISFTPAQEMRAFVWRDGVMSDLGPVNGGFARATDINNRGQVVGDGSVDGMNSVPVHWQNGTVTKLSEGFGTATAINDRGQVTGLYYGGSGSFLWSAGRLTDLGTLPGATFTQAYGINNHGQIVGYTDLDAFVWQDGRMSALPRLSPGNTTAQDINDRGQIVGDSSTSPTGGDSHAVLWTR
jgi:probable HAF family extracellular repeat protein